MSGKCDYAAPGTYGHECGKPATLAASKPHERTPGMNCEPVNGIIWHLRCEQCRDATGRENWGLSNWQPYREEIHVNKWK